MTKVKILIACHKPGPVYKDDVYTPIHVGRAISKCKDQMADMIGDDTGENISNKNPYYCELTAQYWAWKNLHDVEYVGFCHYRRYFDFDIKSINIEKYLNNSVVIVNKKLQNISVEKIMLRYITSEDVHIFLMVMKKLYPDYEKSVIDYLWNNEVYQYNMLICKKDIFNDYAQWLFTIFEECEKYMRLLPYSRGKRAIAYLGEYFMPVYFLHNNIKFCCKQVVSTYGKHSSTRFTYYLNNIFRTIHYKIAGKLMSKPKSLEEYYKSEVLVGFKNDGIEPYK